MVIERKDNVDGIELWTVSPGAAVYVRDDPAALLLVTDSFETDCSDVRLDRRYTLDERSAFILAVSLDSGEALPTQGFTMVVVVEAKVVVE